MKTVWIQNGSRPARALEMLKPAVIALTDADRRRLNGDVARILGKDTISREQLVAEVRQFLTQQL